MNSDIKPVNRNTGKLIAKNIIILTVLITVCSLSIWAWFTKNTKATADGISVMAKAEGVEVSWDGINYYYDLTAKTEAERSFGVGDAKDLRNEDGTPASLQLVTGNGMNFFEPYVNRRTGGVLYTGTDANNNWQGVDIVHGENSQGKYIDLDLYFKGSNASNIYLAQDSSVNPIDATTNGIHKSEYGPFSKDHISAATRVAFLGTKVETDAEGKTIEVVNNEDCKFIWAPNNNVHLQGNSEGYTRLDEDYLDSTSGTVAGDLSEVIEFTTKKGDYYFWLPTNYNSDDETQESTLKSNKMDFTYYDGDKGLYTFEYTIHPTQAKDVTLLYYINENADDDNAENGVEWDHTDLSTYIDESKSAANNDLTDVEPKIALSNNTFTLKSGYVKNYLNPTETWQQDRKGAAFFVGGTAFRNQDITIKIGYNPDDKEVVIISYYCEAVDEYYNRAEKEVTPHKFYELPNTTTNVALVSPQASIAISSQEHNKKAVTFSDSPANNNVTSLSVTLAEQFTATKTGTGYEATYTFKNRDTNPNNPNSGKYIAIKNGKFDWDAETPSEFSLYYKEGFSGPLLKHTVDNVNYILAVVNSNVVAVPENELDLDYAITVYEGTEYKITTETQTEHKYYNSAINATTGKPYGVTLLNESSTPKLYATNTPDPTKPVETEFGECIATLTEDNNFTAHIVIRIWVEGTDNEAQTPLADGIFDVALHFTTRFINTP